MRFVVVGFPRTGTTLLQRILARDPRSSSLAWWECRHPAPFPGWTVADAARVRDPRIADAEAQVAAMLAHNPALAAVHPLDALAPDEDLMLLEHAFQSSTPAGSMNVPSYLRWHLEQDGRASYRDHARFLRFLQWQKRMRGEPVGPFVLKAPHHMIHLDRIFEHHPSATIVQTHRDPLDTLPSLASMALELRRLTSDSVDPRECADYALTTARAGSSGSSACGGRCRRSGSSTSGSATSSRDPLAVVERIYDRRRRSTLPARRARRDGALHRRRTAATSARPMATRSSSSDSTPTRSGSEFAAYREAHVLPHRRRLHRAA